MSKPIMIICACPGIRRAVTIKIGKRGWPIVLTGRSASIPWEPAVSNPLFGEMYGLTLPSEFKAT